MAYASPKGRRPLSMVPVDIYRDRLDIWTGDAKDLLPKMVNEIEQIDFFYHDLTTPTDT